MTREELIKEKAYNLGQKYFSDKISVFKNYNAIKVESACMDMAKYMDENPKPDLIDIEKACKSFSEILVKICPELLGYGVCAKDWENDFRKLLKK